MIKQTARTLSKILDEEIEAEKEPTGPPDCYSWFVRDNKVVCYYLTDCDRECNAEQC